MRLRPGCIRVLAIWSAAGLAGTSAIAQEPITAPPATPAMTGPAASNSGQAAAAASTSKPAKKQGPPPPIRDSERRFQQHVESWQKLKRKNVVMQQREYSCGAAALATLIRYYWGDNVDEAMFLNVAAKILTPTESADRVRNGLSLTDLRRMAVEAGYQASIGTLTMDGLQKSKVPLVIGIKVQEYRHFVVYRGMDQDYVYVADPMRGNIRTLRPEFQKQWQQNAILAVVKPGAKIKETSPLSVTFGELVLGETNKDMIQKTYLRTMIPFPTSIRP